MIVRRRLVQRILHRLRVRIRLNSQQLLLKGVRMLHLRLSLEVRHLNPQLALPEPLVRQVEISQSRVQPLNNSKSKPQ